MAARESVATQLRKNGTQALCDLAPDPGSYANEGDPTEPNFQQTFFGAKHAISLQVKNKFDLMSVFWCESCVGSENWSTAGWDGSASEGVGQDMIVLCRTS